MKIVTMCQGGNSRSVCCAFVLKYWYGIDALACGWEKNSPETLSMLCAWADAVMIMQAEFKEYVPEEFHAKVYAVDVGPDRWFNSLHPELIELCKKLLASYLVPIPVEKSR